MARKDLPFLIIEKGTGLMAGSCGLHRIVWATPKADIGYWVRTSCAGRGYIAEATEAMTRYAFGHMQAARVEIITDEENLPSRRVAERSGFTLEGILKHERRAPDGVLRNTCVYARLTGG